MSNWRVPKWHLLFEFHERIDRIYHGTHPKNGSLSKSSGTFWLALICEKLQHWCSSTHLELLCTELLYEGQRWVQVLARATWWDRGKKKSILSGWMVCNRSFLSGVCHIVLSEEVLTKRCQTTAGRDRTRRYKDSRFFRTTDRDAFSANTALDVPVEEFKVIMFRLYTGS